MNERFILLIYGYFPHLNEGEGPYKVHTIVDERGAVDPHAISTALSESLGRNLEDPHELRFQNLEEINKFGYTLIDELDSPEIGIISIDSYNICLEKSTSLEEFKENITEAANKIENIDYSKDKGILSKLF